MLLLLITFLIIHFGIKQLEKYVDNPHKYPNFFDCVNTLTGLLLFFAVAAILGNKWLLYSTSIDTAINFKMDIRYFHLYHIPVFIPLHVGLSEKMLAFHALHTFCVYVFIVYITHPRIYAHRYTHLPHSKRMSALLNEIRNILIRLFIMQILITIVPDMALGFISFFSKKFIMFTVRFIFKYFVKYPITPFVRYYRHYQKEIAILIKTSIRISIIVKKILFWLLIIALLFLQHGIRLQNKAMFRLLYLKFIPYASYWNLCIKYMVFPWAVVIGIYTLYGSVTVVARAIYEYRTDPDYFFFCLRDFFLWAFYPYGDVPGDPGDPKNNHMDRR